MGLLGRLMRDRRGNALMMLAFALLPLMGAIGSGVDYARASMARSKLQQAVDAAALAGRRSMTADDIETAKADAASYLAFNFPNGLYGSSTVSSVVTKPDVGEVKVVATTTMPTSIMAIFGIKEIPITATGIATQNFENVDIMLVLDTTGSMDEKIDGTTKLDSLKKAVKSLYDQLAPAQEQLARQGLRMRFGIVPYAATVNVGGLLMDKNVGYMQRTSVPYYQWHATKTTKNGKTSTSWAFGLQKYDLTSYTSSLRGSGQLGDVNGNGDFKTSAWAGCIEERKSDPTITGTDQRDGAPATAYDLDIDLIPTSNVDTQWKPYVFDPLNSTSANGGGPNTYCPAEATKLATMTKDALAAKVDTLVSRGSTYHDIGMIWGVRMISSGGIFGGENPDLWMQQKVRRYIIFMTDGVISTPTTYCTTRTCGASTSDYSLYYSSYGIEAWDRRAGATSNDDNDARHTKRFQMACNAAKAKSISIWTIAFGTGRVDSLDKCASSIDQSAVADDDQTLIDTFTQIGKAIGPLRIAH